MWRITSSSYDGGGMKNVSGAVYPIMQNCKTKQKKVWNFRSIFELMMFVLLSVGLPSANASTNVVDDANESEQHIINNEQLSSSDREVALSAGEDYTYSVSNGLERLNEIRRKHLRGGTMENEEAEANQMAVISEVKDILTSQVDHAKMMFEIIQNGNDDEVSTLLSLHIEDTASVAKIAAATAAAAESDFDEDDKQRAFDFLATAEDHDQIQQHGRALQEGDFSFASMDMSSEELLDALALDDDSISDMDYYVDVLDDIERDTLPLFGSHRRRRTSKKNADQSWFGSHISPDNGKSGGRFKLPKLKVIRQLKAEMGIRHGRSLEHKVDPQCQECEFDDYQCNCRRLRDCAKSLTMYDLSATLLGGYVEKDEASDEYAELTVDDMTEIDVYDARNQLAGKMANIRSLADRPISEETCSALLAELHTSCHKESCTDPNMDSFQLSVDQVCAAVDTHTKLKVRTVGEFFDFRRYTVHVDEMEAVETPLDEKRAVRCCRDDEPLGEETLWYTSTLFKSVDCPYALEQKWTGDLSSNLPPPLPVRSATSHDTNASISYSAGGVWTLTYKGSGSLQGKADSFHYTYIQVSGDFDARLRVQSFTGVSLNTMAGVMVRESLAVGSRHFTTLIQGNGFEKQVVRSRTNELPSSNAGRLIGKKDIWLRIQRVGDNYETFYSVVNNPTASTDWIHSLTYTLTMPYTVHFGIAVAAKAGDILTATGFTVNEEHIIPFDVPVQTQVPGYTLYNQQVCKDDNQFVEVNNEEVISVSNVQQCSELCTAEQECLSFDWVNTTCRLSSSCNHFSHVQEDAGGLWYFKNLAPPGFNVFTQGICNGGRSSDLASTNTDTVQECANLCSMHPDCVSFAYPKADSDTRCYLSSICDDYEMSAKTKNDPWNLYIKNDRDDSEDDGICPYMAFAQAERYCDDQGGRLCTKHELENNCASFMGCNSDTSFAWSSTETEPMVCPATSFVTCGNFVTAFDALYNARNTTRFPPSPMRQNKGEVAMPDFGNGNPNFNNVAFPTEYIWEWDKHGVASINPTTSYSYGYDLILSSNPDDSFCDAGLGPPSVLAEACDASMDFLLGHRVSIGLLTSTEKALNDFASNDATDEPTPHWVKWYMGQNDTNSIKYVDEWTDWYNQLEDPGGDPHWLDDYLSIKDPEPFVLSEQSAASSSMTSEIFCIDQDIYGDGRSLQYCQEAWLETTLNPYSMDWYTSIKYPSSDTAPFNETCMDNNQLIQSCKLDWLEETSNPYSEAANPSCHEFWGYCRGYNPSLYQCTQFWIYCRAELDTNQPGWIFPRANCTDPDISDQPILNCAMEWLKDDKNRYIVEVGGDETCHNFWDYCREELDSKYSNWTYPIEDAFCENSPSLTCKTEWLDYETYDEWIASNSLSNDGACHEFFDYCRLQLIAKHPRYLWPLADPPTVDDFMPGYCCLDTPVDTNTDTVFWGSQYTSDRSEAGMKCKNRGFWHQGMSPEACNNGGGHFIRTPCITLHRCIEDRPRKGEPGFNSVFEDWVVAEEIDIYDPSDEKQCEQARVALDFDGQYLNDHEVCKTFVELMCDEFFDDVEFLAGEDGPVRFDQVKYEPIQYPNDVDLFFKPLPPDEDIVDAVRDEETIVKRNTLEISKKALWLAKGTAFEAIDKFVVVQEKRQEASDTTCDNLEAVWMVSKQKRDLLLDKCEILDIVVMGNTNPKKTFCVTGIIPLDALVMANLLAKNACEYKNHFLGGLGLLGKSILWAIHYGIKVAYEIVDSYMFDWEPKKSETIVSHNYIETTYKNTKSQFKWIHGALGIITVNMMEQHKQMRQELQSRHQDITNDVNQYTTCMSNYLGIQMFEALGAKTGQLTSTCRRVLGLSGRRLDGSSSNKLFDLNIEWPADSFIAQQAEIIEGNEETKEDLKIIEADQDKIQDTLENMISAMALVLEKLGLDTSILQSQKDSKSRKSKAKKVKVEEENSYAKDEGIFGRHLLEYKEGNGDDALGILMERKLDSIEMLMEGKLDAVEVVKDEVTSVKDEVTAVKDEVKATKDEVDVIKDKVEKMEKSIQEMKDMLSSLLAAEGVVAG